MVTCHVLQGTDVEDLPFDILRGLPNGIGLLERSGLCLYLYALGK
jgi:hypothetical protein